MSSLRPNSSVKEDSSPPGSPAAFAATRWSIVLAAAQHPHSVESQAALTVLCRTYWYPLYAYVRRRGYQPCDAEDLTQAFFARLLEKSDLQDVDRRRGKFRTFLLTSLENFLANAQDRMRAQKRGGDRAHFSIDFRDAEDLYRIEPSHRLTAERLFDRRWALLLLDRVLSQLDREFERRGRLAVFDKLKDFLVGEKTGRPYVELATELKMSEGAVKVIVHRLRRRYCQLLRNEIAQTTADPGQIDEEIRALYLAIAD